MNKGFPGEYELPHNSERNSTGEYIFRLDNYISKAPRIIGLQELQKVQLKVPDPIFIIGHQAFERYKKSGLTGQLYKEVLSAFSLIRQADPNRGCHIGRGFFIPGIDNPPGLRTSTITNPDIFVDKIKDFYEFVRQKGYDIPGADIALIIHPFINAGDPLMIKDPPLEFPGGVIYSPTDGKIEIHSTFGPDESYQGFPKDTYTVNLFGQRIEITKQISRKKRTLIPSAKDPLAYDEIDIPKEFQSRQALPDEQILELATAYLKVSNHYGPRRMEFLTQPDGIYFRECQPFNMKAKDLIHLSSKSVEAEVLVIRTASDISKIDANTKLVHLPEDLFQHRQIGIFAACAATIHQLAHDSIVLPHGDIVTSHMLRNFADLGITVVFIGNNHLENGERIRVYRTDGRVEWERIESINKLFLSLNDKKLENRIVGSKALNLYLLAEAGLITPRGYCLTADAFDKYIYKFNLTSAIEKLEGLEGKKLSVALKRIRDKITGGKINHKDKEYILNALNGLKVNKYSVRSSANVEDQEVSFAGQFSSTIGIPQEQVIYAIKQSWASVFNEGSILYARGLRISPLMIKMGVLTHETIEGEKAGVIFTRHPETGNFVVSISDKAENIVEGQASQFQQIEIDRKTRMILKHQLHTNNRQPIMNQDEIQELFSIGMLIEQIFGRPQDIEWVINKQTGKLVCLQSRPV
ncbi:MAG: PEP/pyruvate-binding domain-containing protein [Candidatus Gottesmanbacteria bacterium]